MVGFLNQLVDILALEWVIRLWYAIVGLAAQLNCKSLKEQFAGTQLPSAERPETTQKYVEPRETMEKYPTLSHVEVAQKEFKSKSRDRVLGFEGGITLKEKSGQPSRVELQSKLNEANKQKHVLTNRVDTVQEENNALKSRMSSVEDELNELNALKKCSYNAFQEMTL
ncbi:uncharacterized protein [Spinacia oleracea]|uniref:Uncharacterized protein isoform X1 n=1 Tax=Spinacia oleracea TaxID=3562 RepID=A0ABM3QUQ7_SPIOL|nr:uncharacterized protein LOC130462575 isoform X1 [Spinacia oleracea]